MTIKDLKNLIKNLPDESKIYVSCDEELNIIFAKWEFDEFENKDKNPSFIIYGLSGSEIE